MQLATNLILYIFLSLGAGYILRSFKDEEGAPKLKWYVGGLIIGAVCGVVNAVLVSGGLLFGAAFNLDTVLGPFLGGLGTGLLIGIPIGLITAYDMFKRFTFVDGWLLFFKIIIIFIVIGGTISSLAVPKYTSQQWFDFFVFGLAQGGIYALIALGYTLVYGILFMINFAHGEIFMSGAFTAFFVARALATPPAEDMPAFLDTNPLFALLMIFLTAMITSTIVAVTVERIAYKPLRYAPRLVPLITAIGASFFLQYTFRGFYGSGVEAYPQVPALTGDLLIGDLMLFLAFVIVAGAGGWASTFLHRRLKKVFIDQPRLSWLPFTLTVFILLLVIYLVVPVLTGGLVSVVNSAFPITPEYAAEHDIATTAEVALSISKIQFTVIISSVSLMVGLYYFVQKTKIGKAMRAVAEDKDVAALMGINVDQVISITFALGAALAGAAGVLYGLMFRQVNFFMGFFPGLKAFTAAVLGGIGNVPGAMIGGLFLGIFESVGPSLFLEGLGIPAPYQLKDAIAFTMLVLVLIFRPTGIMGVDLSKKKA
ncbi:MAG: branched-chain amino acid ABC transporter permease [Anaerolineae bacterium]|nr:branched-chain amino acid ABC transporter permease [Anaerolineae bacterium]